MFETTRSITLAGFLIYVIILSSTGQSILQSKNCKSFAKRMCQHLQVMDDPISYTRFIIDHQQTFPHVGGAHFYTHLIGSMAAVRTAKMKQHPLPVVQQMHEDMHRTGLLFNIAVQHGFIWHFLSRQGIAFPRAWDLLPSWCNASALGLVEEHGYFSNKSASNKWLHDANGLVNTTEECIHGFGHAAFFQAAASRPTFAKYNPCEPVCPFGWNARNEIPHVVGLFVSFCLSAPTTDTLVSCLFGAYHSLGQYAPAALQRSDRCTWNRVACTALGTRRAEACTHPASHLYFGDECCNHTLIRLGSELSGVSPPVTI